MSRESKTPDARSRTTKATVANVTLRAAESSKLTGICIELIDLCTKEVTGRIDPKVGSVPEYASDHALLEVLEIGS
jgi:hypothetical protein